MGPDYAWALLEAWLPLISAEADYEELPNNLLQGLRAKASKYRAGYRTSNNIELVLGTSCSVAFSTAAVNSTGSSPGQRHGQLKACKSLHLAVTPPQVVE